MRAPLRLVVDTNVVVSALLNPGRTPDRALVALCAHGCRVLYDERVLAEWREVLSRKKFQGIDPARAERLIDALLARGELVTVLASSTIVMIDESDAPFVEVALAGHADGLVTGNVRHFPPDIGFALWPPAALLERLG